MGTLLCTRCRRRDHGGRPRSHDANSSVSTLQRPACAHRRRDRITIGLGERTSLQPGDFDAYHFAGMDEDGSNFDAQYRKYNPTQGRWLSPDLTTAATTSPIRRVLTAITMCSIILSPTETRLG